MQFAASLRMRRREALGVAIEWFCWVDAQCTDGYTGLLPGQVDDVLECKRLAEALLAVGWASVGPDGLLYVAEFDKHHGEGAKNRALAAERQARFKATKSNADSVTEVTADALPRERIYSNNTVVGRFTGDSSAPGSPAPTPNADEEMDFSRWLAALCAAHPSAGKSRTLAPDVLLAAQAAFKRCPAATAQAELLAAYFASKKAVDSYKKPFYRPIGQRKFFDDLEDVLCHAERWAAEFGWGKKTPKRGKTVATPGAQAERCAGVLHGAEAMAFIRGETDEL